MKVLIIDADWRFTQQAVDFLEARANNVVLQPSPRDALEQAKHWQPDLVIVAAEFCDPDFMEALRSLPRRPAVLLTEFLGRYDRAWQAWQRGGDDLLIKPIFSMDDLQDAIVTARENAAAGVRTRPGHKRASA